MSLSTSKDDALTTRGLKIDFGIIFVLFAVQLYVFCTVWVNRIQAMDWTLVMMS